MQASIQDRLEPSPLNAGFKMDGYYIWGGSIMKVGDLYQLFASRWPKSTKFPDGYRNHSEIVRASSQNPMGPFNFKEVVLAGRGGKWWDGLMCHNPKILQFNGTYVLYYIGSAIKSRKKRRKIGYAFSRSIEGPWIRLEKPLPLGVDQNNPAPYFHKDGRVLMAFRDHHLKMHIVQAPRWDGEYKIIAKDIFDGIKVEDPHLAFWNNRYHMVVEDNRAGLTGMCRFGAHMVSDDGIAWKKHDPLIMYDHNIRWEDGTVSTMERRERPEIFNDDESGKGNGKPTHLITAVLKDNLTWCHIQTIGSR